MYGVANGARWGGDFFRIVDGWVGWWIEVGDEWGGAKKKEERERMGEGVREGRKLFGWRGVVGWVGRGGSEGL